MRFSLLRSYPSRLLALFSGSSGGLALLSAAAFAQPIPEPIPAISITATRTEPAITGTSSSTITSEDIERSPSYTLTDIISREAGVQTQNLFGSINGARSTVDLRGFGATATSNTLVLVNGRRVHDLDLQGIDFSSIPLNSIERVEITRGNSGAVLYGDGAVGGVINIITKNGVNLPPSARIEGAFGSYRQREGIASGTVSSGPFSAAVFGNAIGSNSYRRNNEYQQYNGVGDFRYTLDRGSIYLNVTGSDQKLGLPAYRRVEPSKGINQVVTDPRGATTPFDYADTQNQSVTTGGTLTLMPGAELIVDGGLRQKQQQSGFFDQASPAFPVPINYVEATLTTKSLTPRLKTDMRVVGLPWRSISGIDFYDDGYVSPRSLALGDVPFHRYDLSQTTLAAYSQHTVTVFNNTDLSAGARVQRTSIKASDTFDPNAPGACPFGFCGDPQGIPFVDTQTNHAFHLGLEHRLTSMLTIFGRHAQAFRVPNVDERVGSITLGNGDPTMFNLKTQRSHDWEVGARGHFGPVNVQWSYYDMSLTDEIMFRFGPNFVASNTNLDPTRRYGHEAIASWQATDTVRFKANYSYTRAVFREGIFAGNDVPLTSRNTASAGVTWNVIDKRLVFDGTVRYVGERRMDNDQTNVQPLIPDFTLVDVRIGGEIEKFYWSASVQNLFDRHYFDYAVASPFPFGFLSAIGTFNAYPQPGRTFLVRAGYRF